MRFPERRIDDRIRQLCAKVTSATDDDDFQSLRQELLELARQKCESLKRQVNGEYLEPRRRSTDLTAA